MAKFPNIKNRFILAPMAGITDDPFRRLCLEQGAGLVYSEMVSAKALHYNDAKSLELLRHAPDAVPIAYQLFGSEPEIMAEAVMKLDELAGEGGGERQDGSGCGSGVESGRGFGPAGGDCADPRGKVISCVSYDINMGCPVPKVAKNGEGSALMRDPDKAAGIVKAMVRATDKPITVKTRIGWDSSSVNVVEFARAMEEAGAAAIAVHGRTREQYYSGKADWSAIARVKEAAGIPVIGSGDIMSGEDARRMLSETGCDYVMIARGALGNPWIFGAALNQTEPQPDLEQRARMFTRHARMLEADKGEYIAVREMRKHTGWYFKGTHGVTSLRAKVNTIETIEELMQAVERWKNDAGCYINKCE
jgi:nifR3 family TIM-barrel protein